MSTGQSAHGTDLKSVDASRQLLKSDAEASHVQSAAATARSVRSARCNESVAVRQSACTQVGPLWRHPRRSESAAEAEAEAAEEDDEESAAQLLPTLASCSRHTASALHSASTTLQPTRRRSQSTVIN